MLRQTRKSVTLGFTTAACVLVLTSTAWACTVWVGKLTVWGVSSGSSGTVSATGADLPYSPVGGSSMAYCSAPSGTANVGPAGAALRQIALTYVTQACGTRAGEVPDGAYIVNYLPDKSADCMNGVQIGAYVQDSTNRGATRGPFTVPGVGSDPSGGALSTGTRGWADICVDHVGSVKGNQVPIFMI